MLIGSEAAREYICSDRIACSLVGQEQKRLALVFRRMEQFMV